MADEIAFENGWISNFEGLVTLTLTLDRVILHTVVHHSLTSTHVPNFIEIEESFLWTDGRTHARTYVRTHGRSDGHTGWAKKVIPLVHGNICTSDITFLAHPVH